MFDYKLAQVEKRIGRLVKKGMLHSRKLYVFGVSENTRQIIQILRSYGLEPEHVLDNDKRKQNTYCCGILVIPVEEIPDIGNEKNRFLIYSAYWTEMTAQLREQGVKKSQIHMLYRDESLGNCLYYAAMGKRLHERLKKKYGDIRIFLCPYTGTGDIYLIGTFWKQYMERNPLEDYVFVVISKACEKAAMLFDIKNIEVLQKKMESCYLIQYFMLCPDKVNLKILNDSWAQIHTNPLEWFRGYKGLEFTPLFRKFVFDLPEEAKPEHPVFRDVREELKGTFEELELKEGHTVILSPYSNTLADLPDRFWNQLAGRLKEMGFAVCTNSSKDTEPAVKGTIPVFFPLNTAPQWVEMAGYFIGVRSGFCDVISGARAKKVILYGAHDRFFNASSFEYFNLKDMGLCEDAAEIEFESGDEKLIEKVIDQLGEEHGICNYSGI